MIDKIKRDTQQNWAKAINFVPKEGEVIIFDCEDKTRIKIGDGITKVNNLKFAEDTVPFSNTSKVEEETLIVQ